MTISSAPVVKAPESALMLLGASEEDEFELREKNRENIPIISKSVSLANPPCVENGFRSQQGNH